MGSEAPLKTLGYRPPWYWLPVLGVAALAATLLVVANARSRVRQNETQFRSGQQVRLHQIETRIDDYFGKAIQLVSTGAQTLGPLHDDRPLARELVAELFRSRSTDQIYGLGVFFEPYAFSSSIPYFDVYDYVDGGRMRESFHDPRLPPYTRLHWYERGIQTPGETRFDGPFTEHGISYISTILGFTRNGRPAGVMAVDTLTPWFVRQNIVSQTQPGDIAWIESSRRGKALLQTAPFPEHGDLIDEVIRLRYTSAYIHLSSDASAMHASNARIVTMSTIIAVAIWVISALLAAALVQVWRSRLDAVALEEDRARLESEIAVGKRVEAELRKAAFSDVLTGLPNRAAFLEQASAAIAESARGTGYAVFFIDLDRFNMINETMGHLAGDELLKMIATRLRESLAGQGMIARLGGDEFVVLAQVAPSGAAALAQAVLATLHDPMLLGGRLLYTGASIGVVVVDAGYSRPEELLRDADIAMYEAKRQGRSCFVVFDTAMRSRVAAESDLETDLRSAIERHEFVPFYQPILDANTQQTVSFEALVRWRRPGSGVVGASEFIGYAERTGLVDAIDRSVLEDVSRDARSLFRTFPEATVAVNVSASHLTAPNLAEAVNTVMRANPVLVEKLKLEITETAIMRNADQARATLESLRRNGIQIVLDDFGAGHSSLAYLHRLPIAGLKIDRSFVAALATDATATPIVRSIVALAEALDLYTVAEGVETAEQLELVRKLGVRYAQGFLFSPAIPLASIIAGEQRINA